MADAIYPKFKEAALQGNTDLAGGTVKAMLVDGADYTYGAAHEFLDDIPAAAQEETSPALTTKAFTDGTFNADDVTFTGTAGDDCEAVVLFIDSGTASTSRLICYLDSIAGFPVTLGGDITIEWDDGSGNIDGIFQL